MKKVILFILILGLVGALYGCGGTPKTATPTENPPLPKGDEELLKKAKMGNVMTMSDNWDEDAEDDGIVVYPSLEDENGETIKFENVEIPVDIEIYTSKYDKDFNKVEPRLIYKGKSKITSWKDGNFMFNGGIRIPWEDIKTVEKDSDIGVLYVHMHLPDGRTISAKDDATRIKPEE